MIKRIIGWLVKERILDYKITGAYYDTDENGHTVVKYHKKYYFKKHF